MHILQLDYTYIFCSFNCFKKILNVKILKWKFCRKTLILSSVWLQSPSLNSTAPSAYSQGPVPNCWVSVQNDCNKAVTAPENTWPLCDPKMFNLGGFGPKLISLYCLIK